MTQFQFEVICKIINTAAPALAPELCGALNNLIISYNKLAEENVQLKANYEATDEAAVEVTAN